MPCNGRSHIAFVTLQKRLMSVAGEDLLHGDDGAKTASNFTRSWVDSSISLLEQYFNVLLEEQTPARVYNSLERADLPLTGNNMRLHLQHVDDDAGIEVCQKICSVNFVFKARGVPEP